MSCQEGLSTVSVRAVCRALAWVRPGLLLGIVLLWTPPGCEPGQGRSGVDQQSAALTRPASLSSRARWQRLNPAGTFRVSPAWSPGGAWVAAAGRRGRGLFLLEARGAGERAVDAEHRGSWHWRSGDPGEVLCIGAGDEADCLDVETGEPRGVGSPEVWDDERGRRVWDDGSQQLFHHPRRGTITVVRNGRAPLLVVGGGAWGVRVSRTGRRIAYSTGTLVESELFVYDLLTAQTRALGPGVHPCWFPDDRRLIFTRITHVVRRGGLVHVTEADLQIHDAGTGAIWPATQTPGVAEMQPVVSPDGLRVAFSDWQDGTIYVAPLRGAAP